MTGKSLSLSARLAAAVYANSSQCSVLFKCKAVNFHNFQRKLRSWKLDFTHS